MVQYKMPNGEIVPVPQDVVSQGGAAEQGFYDGQSERVAGELGISVVDLHSKAYAADPQGFVAAALKGVDA